MNRDLSPESMLNRLEARDLAAYYLFYGPNEFLKENIISEIRQTLLDPGTADFNLQIFYADESPPEHVLEAASSVPFMAEHRVVIVRRTENYKKADQDRFLPYLERPVTSTYLLFMASNVDFRQPLFSRIRKAGRAVFFAPMKEGKVVGWLRSTANDMGLNISHEACAYLHQIVGNSLLELYGELEKLSIRYGDRPVEVEQIKEMAANTRAYSIFELTDHISEKDTLGALEALHRLMAQAGKESALGILGMLNRQLRLLWQVKFMKEQGREREIAKLLGIPSFLVRKLASQADRWTDKDLREFLESLCLADSRLKSGSREDVILDHLIMLLCQERSQEESWFTR